MKKVGSKVGQDLEKIAIDFGSTTIDVILWFHHEPRIVSFNRADFGWEVRMNILTLFERVLFELKIDWKAGRKIVVTGGRSSFLPTRYKGMNIVRIPEIEAIGRGGIFLMNQADTPRFKKFLKGRHQILVASFGTGTCFVQVTLQNGVIKHFRHCGGTGFGGATYMAFAKMLVGTNTLAELEKLALHGDYRNVDLLIDDVVGKKLSSLEPSMSAAHFAKLSGKNSQNIKPADIAAALNHMMIQTLSRLTLSSAQASGCEAVIAGGKMLLNPLSQAAMRQFMKRNKMPFFIPAEGGLISAYGC